MTGAVTSERCSAEPEKLHPKLAVRNVARLMLACFVPKRRESADHFLPERRHLPGRRLLCIAGKEK